MAILTIVKVKGLERNKKILKKCLKNILYGGISTKNRIDYWHVLGKIPQRKEINRKFYQQLQLQKSECEMSISVDIGRTYPSLDFFKVGQTGYEQLLRILKAISFIFPKIG